MERVIQNNVNNSQASLVSIIIPIYNVERYLRDCIESVIKQTYKNLEIILINDGSPDNSGNICDEYANQDARIKVVHKNNGGLSDARNVGLDIAHGAYISFIDSDDVINEDFIRILLSMLYDSDASISMCDYTEFSTIIPKIDSTHKNTFELYTGEYMLNNLYNKCWTPRNVIACNKLYERSVWDGLRYSVGVLHEDEYIIHELYAKVQSVTYCSAPLYYYRQRESSITKEISSKRIEDILAIFDLRTTFFRKRGYNDLIVQNANAKLLNIAILAITYKNKTTRRLLVENLPAILKQRNVPLKMKCSCVILAAFPKIFWRIKSLRKRAV